MAAAQHNAATVFIQREQQRCWNGVFDARSKVGSLGILALALALIFADSCAFEPLDL